MLSKFPVLLICQILIRFNGVDIGTVGSRVTLSGFKAFAGGAVGLGVDKAELAPATQILPSKSIAKDVAISFAVLPNRTFQSGAPRDE